MEYREALKIGSRAEGIIKCTYAELFDKNGKKLISLQNYIPHGPDPTYQLACVEITEISNSRLVPCYLLNNAFDYIVAVLSKRVAKKEKVDETDAMYESTRRILEELIKSGKMPKTQNTAKAIIEKVNYKDILKCIQRQVLNGEPFYIKPAAFDWFPINTDNMKDSDKKKTTQKTTTSIAAIILFILSLCGK